LDQAPDGFRLHQLVLAEGVAAIAHRKQFRNPGMAVGREPGTELSDSLPYDQSLREPSQPDGPHLYVLHVLRSEILCHRQTLGLI
jgi:hypothetical protein